MQSICKLDNSVAPTQTSSIHLRCEDGSRSVAATTLGLTVLAFGKFHYDGLFVCAIAIGLIGTTKYIGLGIPAIVSAFDTQIPY